MRQLTELNTGRVYVLVIKLNKHIFLTDIHLAHCSLTKLNVQKQRFDPPREEVRINACPVPKTFMQDLISFDQQIDTGGILIQNYYRHKVF